jgi:hypothetical protein
MIPQTRLRQRQNCRRKKHSLVIGMRDQETDAFVPELGEFRARHTDGI